MELAIILILFFAGLLLANFLYDVWKNRKRDYVGEIRRGELAIENDDLEALNVCFKRVWKTYYELRGKANYYFYNAKFNDWDCAMNTTLPTIKASELIKHLNK